MENRTIDRQALYEQVWAEPMTKVAARLGISSVGLAKICRKLQVPVPTRGYWARRTAGNAPQRPPLRPAAEGAPLSHSIVTRPVTPAPKRAPSIEAALKREREGENITVPETVSQFHPQLRPSLAILRKRRGDDYLWRQHSCVDIDVTAPLLDRALRIVNTIFVELERRGLSAEVRPPTGRRDTYDPEAKGSRTVVSVENETIEFRLYEWIRWVRVERPRVTVPARRGRRIVEPLAEHEPIFGSERRGDGRLRLAIRTDKKIRRMWRDEPRHKIESRLNAFISGLYVAADELRVEREQAAAWTIRREEEARRRRAQEERQRRHDALVEDARRRIDHLGFARSMRALVADVEARLVQTSGPPAPDSSEGKWLKWAAALAEDVENEVLTSVAKAWKQPSW